MSYRELPVQMHPRYAEFLKFMADCPHRKTPSTMETAFWAWLKAQSSDSQEVRDLAIFSSEQAVEIQILKNDLDRLHRERDSFQQQARVLAEEVERLNGLFCDVYDAVGERGDACLSIDGGNL
jgi:23S rRNA G2069 N7-methylase RlmK/C1962 C5-methylase RlmI